MIVLGLKTNQIISKKNDLNFKKSRDDICFLILKH